jgi:anaerobic magnesium-protoporphyrin IX monomethyl ester cyclase
MRSPANVAGEMALVKRTLAPDHVWFADDIFGLQPKWVAELAREVEERDAVIPFTIQSRADLMTPVAVAGLVRAGCSEVWLGAESGSQKILDAMDKGLRVEQIVAATRRLQAAGIRACWFLQFGYPGETWEDVSATVSLVREILPDDVGVSVSYPLPGTRFFDMVQAELGEKTHWQHSNDLAMMFEGTYQTPFYRKLRQVVHADLNLRLKIRKGEACTSELGCLDADWRELERLERTCRSDTPTAVHKPYAALPEPDLSRTWN